MSDQRLIVINLWAGPGAGKSTAAAGLFNLMKNQHYSVELVTEFAKDMVYAGRLSELTTNQLYVFSKQEKRQRSLLGKSKILITDSPLPLSLIYQPKEGAFASDEFRDFVLAVWRSSEYENYNVLINRVKPYVTQGRLQGTEEEARAIDHQVQDLLGRIVHPTSFFKANGDAAAPYRILEWLQNEKMILP